MAPASPPPLALLVDDDPGVLAFLGEVLDAAGWQHTAVSRGDAVVELCRELQPELVLMDVLMPGSDGFTVLSHIRSDRDLDDVRVVLVSGGPSEVHGEIARRLGAEDFLEKPPSLSALERVLRVSRAGASR